MTDAKKRGKFSFDFSKIKRYAWPELYYIDYQREINISMLRRLLQNLETTYKAQEKTLIQAIKQAEEDLSEEMQGSYFVHMDPDFRELNELLRWQRFSVYITTFALFEGEFQALVQKIEEKFSFQIKLKDLKSSEGGDIKTYWIFLLKVFEIQPINSEKFFTPLTQMKKLRNIITHQAGIPIREDLKHLKPLIDQRLIGIKDNHGIYLDIKLLKKVIDNVDSFFDKLLPEIDLRYQTLTKEKPPW